IPEGWLLDIAQNSWKIDQRDRMSLLLACCKDCIGDIGVIELKSDE
ncbi:MAG: HipA N-terminal domain-containing protein, partial [Bacteroidales bacterium]|nr:HipA N-terminal domain-containing protein [Bacteroidales bacterium]